MMNNGFQSHMGGVEICMDNTKFAAKDTKLVIVPLEEAVLVWTTVTTSESANTPNGGFRDIPRQGFNFYYS